MTGSRTTSRTSAEMKLARERGQSQSDWERVRRLAHRDPLAAEQDRKIGELLARKPGRPPAQRPHKQPTTIRFDADVLAALKSTGKGWQTRVNEAMREWVKTHLA